MYAEDLIVGNDEIRNRKATGRFSIPFRVRRKDGSDIWVRLDACRAEERWNGHEVLYCFYTDIDEQQRRGGRLPPPALFYVFDRFQP